MTKITTPYSEAAAHSILNMCRQLVSLVHIASKSSEKLMGLSAAQLFVLNKLRDNESRSLNELASLTHTHQSSVSVVVKKLVDKKLVMSRPAKDDARRLELSLTAAGKKTLTNSPEPVQEQIIRGIQSLSIKDCHELDRLMKVMLVGIHSEDRPAQLFFED